MVKNYHLKFKTVRDNFLYILPFGKNKILSNPESLKAR